MRPIPILLVLACGTVFGQENTPPPPITPTPQIYENLRQRLGDMFRSQQLSSQQLRTSGNAPAAQPLRITVAPPEIKVCSIPLLNAKASGNPVPMPNMMPRNNLFPANKPPIDRMEAVAPAPPCPADFARNAIPAPVPGTPPAATPEPAQPAKP